MRSCATDVHMRYFAAGLAQERKLEELQKRRDREKHWTEMESGRKARVMALASMMSGSSPPVRAKARVEPRRLGKGAKAALKAYATWAREHRSQLSDEQLECLSRLLRAWSAVDLRKSEGAAMPPLEQLTELHRGLARSGVGNFDKWRAYIDRVRQLEHQATAPVVEEKEEEAVEAYVDDRQMVSIDELNDLMRRARWDAERESKERDEQERIRQRIDADKPRPPSHRHADVLEVLDDDGFVVEASSQVADEPVVDVGPATAEAYTWADESERVSLYVELSRPVKAQELEVLIEADCLSVRHAGAKVVSRKLAGRVSHRDDDTSWFLDDAGDVLKFELVKAEPTVWQAVFEGDACGFGRTQRRDDQRFDWTQSVDDLTLTARVLRTTAKEDCRIAIKRDSLRVYVRGLGVLVDGALNRSVVVADSSWSLCPPVLTVFLVKLEKLYQPWQRLVVGGAEIEAQEAYKQMAADSVVPFDELDHDEQLYAEQLRDLKSATARGDDVEAAAILHDLDDMNFVMEGDLDRPQRKRILDAIEGRS